MYYAKENPDYSPVSFGEVEDGSNEWLALREHGPGYADPLSSEYIPVVIGGSSVAVIFGDSPWKSALELYHEKSGLAKAKYERKKNEVILNSGHQLEEWVALTFLRKMQEEGIKVEIWNDTNMYQHPFYKFAVGNFDRRIKVNGIPGILECKTTSNWDDIKNYWQKGICPKKYEWQCRYYMAIANVKYVYITCCWGMGPDDCSVILINRDLDIEEVMMEEVSNFVECCIDGIEPSLDSENLTELSKYYTRLYGEISEDAPPVELPDTQEVFELLKSAEDIFERKEKLQEKMDNLSKEEAKITCSIMKLTGGQSSYATYRLDDNTVMSIKLKLPLKRAAFDEEKLKTEHPDVYAQYLKTEEKFDVTKYKKENKVESKAYILPAKVDPEKAATLKEVKMRTI